MVMYKFFFITLPKVASHPAYQNSVIRKHLTVPFLKYERLKLKLRVFLAGHSIILYINVLGLILLQNFPSDK